MNKLCFNIIILTPYHSKSSFLCLYLNSNNCILNFCELNLCRSLLFAKKKIREVLFLCCTFVSYWYWWSYSYYYYLVLFKSYVFFCETCAFLYRLWVLCLSISRKELKKANELFGTTESVFHIWNCVYSLIMCPLYVYAHLVEEE